jgi:hypothetical protein
MANQYLQQTSTLSAVLPGIIPAQVQQQNQFSSIITDITSLFNAVNGLLGNGTTGSSWFQNQNVVTGQRSLGSIYQNTSGRTMQVTVTNNISSTSSVTVYTDSSLNPTTEVGANNTQSTNSPISFMVLNNNYYKLNTTGTVVLVCWTEWS